MFLLLHKCKCWLIPQDFEWVMPSILNINIVSLHWDMQDLWCGEDDGPPFFHVLSTHLIRNLSLLHAFSLMYCHLDIICMSLKDVQWRIITRYNLVIISFYLFIFKYKFKILYLLMNYLGFRFFIILHIYFTNPILSPAFASVPIFAPNLVPQPTQLIKWQIFGTKESSNSGVFMT